METFLQSFPDKVSLPERYARIVRGHLNVRMNTHAVGSEMSCRSLEEKEILERTPAQGNVCDACPLVDDLNHHSDAQSHRVVKPRRNYRSWFGPQ
jgi:hypothetical protein